MTLFADINGLQITASCEETVRRLDEFGHALLSFSEDVDRIPKVADDDQNCPVAQAYAVQFFVSGGTKESYSLALKYLDRALYLYSDSLPREQGIITAAQYTYRTELHTAAAVLDNVLDDNPGDIISAKWAQGLHFDIGNAAGILRAPTKVARQHDANPYLHGMLAFGFEECHLLEQAEHSVMRALELEPAEPWAHHAMAHINEARSTLASGLDFMLEMSETWNGLTSFMFTHNWWHICLFLIDLNRGEEALDYFDQHVWTHNRDFVQDEINAISLLYRLERSGIDIGTRWTSVAEAVVANSRSQLSVFLDIHFLFALIRDTHPEAPDMIERMMKKAETTTGNEQIPWSEVARHLVPGIVDLLEEDYASAVDHLCKARPAIKSIGGSHTQRDLVALLYIDALYGAGQWNDVRTILSLRYLNRPDTVWIRNQLEEAYENLGLGGVLMDG